MVGVGFGVGGVEGRGGVEGDIESIRGVRWNRWKEERDLGAE